MLNQVFEPTSANIEKATQILKNGGVVGMPTETVYGLAASAFHVPGIEHIFSTKERPTFDPLIVHVANLDQTLSLINPAFLSTPHFDLFTRLTAALWPGPLTCILPKSTAVPDLVTSGLPSVGIRMPKHEVALRLIEAAGPLAAPSANRFGRISPTSSEAVWEELGHRVSMILEGGKSVVGVESTVLDFTSEPLRILRPGAVTAEQIFQVIGILPELCFLNPNHSYLPEKTDAYLSPGMLKSHYAPVTPLLFIDEKDWLNNPDSRLKFSKLTENKSLSFLLQNDAQKEELQAFLNASSSDLKIEVLSAENDLGEKARNLFEKLRALDASHSDLIVALPCYPALGLGYAISDRLKKAASLTL